MDLPKLKNSKGQKIVDIKLMIQTYTRQMIAYRPAAGLLQIAQYIAGGAAGAARTSLNQQAQPANRRWRCTQHADTGNLPHKGGHIVVVGGNGHLGSAICEVRRPLPPKKKRKEKDRRKKKEQRSSRRRRGVAVTKRNLLTSVFIYLFIGGNWITTETYMRYTSRLLRFRWQYNKGLTSNHYHGGACRPPTGLRVEDGRPL